MDWTDRMKKAMTDLQSACKENEEWNDCWECPFKRFCDVLEETENGNPEEWDLEKLFE